MRINFKKLYPLQNLIIRLFYLRKPAMFVILVLFKAVLILSVFIAGCRHSFGISVLDNIP